MAQDRAPFSGPHDILIRIVNIAGDDPRPETKTARPFNEENREIPARLAPSSAPAPLDQPKNKHLAVYFTGLAIRLPLGVIDCSAGHLLHCDLIFFARPATRSLSMISSSKT